MFNPERDELPPEPGTVEDTCLGLTDDEVGNPSPEPPEDDQELGDSEMLTGDGDDLEDEEE